ncbi:MAG: hypothetical protein SFU87_11765 [Chitinophagaceae bacterium]|nr:hypothetical protein [Chitinophagaceae bacterium]
MLNNTNTILFAGIIVVVLVAVLYFIIYSREKKELKKQARPSAAASGLQLQAYERLTILAERIALPNLVTRIPAADLSAKQLQGLLVDTIKQEFDYNISQQIYVSPQAWQAVSNLKEQNIFIINQLAGTLPQEAGGKELSKKILKLLNADTNASLHPIVLQALRFEAKKLM